ncbi:MAG: hypothetical protein HYV07_05835 [Deltaproteobacteria bacterium]|nr:hypothetical protein [Deltaproteobacteria bacterium]
MYVGGSGNYQQLQQYLQFNQNLQTELQGAVQRAAAKTLLDQATGLMPPNLDALFGSPSCMAGSVMDPSMACGRMGMPSYLSNEQLGAEQVGVERTQVDGQSQAKKGSGVQPSVQNKPVMLSPQQVEAKIATDPMFRARMEQKLGGRVLLDGNADGNITVERPLPFGAMPQGLGNIQQGCMGFMNRMDATMGAAMGAALGQQLMQQSAAQLAQQFAGGCMGPFMPPQAALASAFQAGQMSGFAQGYQAGQMAGLLGGTQGMPGVCGHNFAGLPNAMQLGGAVEQMMSNVVGMHACLSNTAAVFAQAQASMAAWQVQALGLPRN